MPHYQSKPCTIVRDAKAGDEGFDPSLAPGSQILIRLENGSTKVVSIGDVRRT